MAFRFFRRKKIAPGVTLNFSKSGPSLSFGPRGAKYTVGQRGTRTTVGVPGTGMYYTKSSRYAGGGRGRSGSGRGTGVPTPTGIPASTGGPAPTGDDRALVAGALALSEGDADRAFEQLRPVPHLPDAAFLLGILLLNQERNDEAIGMLEYAEAKHSELGRLLSKYGLSTQVSLPITDEMAARVGPGQRGVLLVLIEAYQRAGRIPDALAAARRLLELEPVDVVVRLSLAELLLAGDPGPVEYQQVVRLAEDVENTSEPAAALLLYKGRALRGLGLPEAARDALTAAGRRRKDRSDELLLAVRYERALAYQEMGQRSRARGELGKVYAEDPDYEDVAEQLGLGERILSDPRHIVDP